MQEPKARGCWLIFPELAAVFLLALFSFLRFRDHFTITIFQARDLARAEALAAGIPVFFGPEMSGGGLLPGGFYYALLAAPKLLGLDYQGLRIFQLVLLAVSVTLLWRFFRRHFGIYPAFFALVAMLPSLNPERQHKFSFLNPGFLPLFFLSALICLCYSFAHLREKRIYPWAAFCLLCSLGGQIHFSGLLLMAPAVALQFFARPLRLPALSTGDFRKGILLFLIPLLPHLLWLGARSFSYSIGQEPFPNAASAQIDWKFAPLSALGNYGFGPHTLLEAAARFAWLIPLELILSALLILPFAIARGQNREATGADPDFARDCLVILCVTCLFLLPQALYFLIAKIFYRYTFAFTAALQMLSVMLLAWAQKKTPALPALAVLATVAISAREAWEADLQGKALSYWLMASALVLILSLLLGAVHRRQRKYYWRFGALALAALPFLIPHEDSPYNSNFGGNRLAVETQRKIAEEIHARTGWSYAEARQRIFYVNVHNENSLAPVYRVAEKNPLRLESGVAIDGFFVTMLPRFDTAQFSREAMRNHLLSAGLEKSLRAGLLSGDLELGPSVPHKNIAITPYQVKNKEKLPPYFHNRGDGYDESAVWEAPPALEGARFSTLTVANCRENAELCRTIVNVERRQNRKGTLWEFQVSIRGQGLSQASDWISPKWTEAWVEPYFSLTCAGRERRVPLADSLGFNATHDLYPQSSSFLAPFHRRFQLHCEGGPEKMAFGYKSSVISQKGHPFRELPGLQFSLNL